MSIKSPTIQPADCDDPALRGVDVAAVLGDFVSGEPFDPAIVERVRARAEQVAADIRRDHGVIDDDTFQSLLDDEA